MDDEDRGDIVLEILSEAKERGGQLTESEYGRLNGQCNTGTASYDSVREMAREMNVTDPDGRPLYKK